MTRWRARASSFLFSFFPSLKKGGGGKGKRQNKGNGKVKRRWHDSAKGTRGNRGGRRTQDAGRRTQETQGPKDGYEPKGGRWDGFLRKWNWVPASQRATVPAKPTSERGRVGVRA